MVKQEEFDNVCRFIAGKYMLSFNQVKTVITADKVGLGLKEVIEQTGLESTQIDRVKKLFAEIDAV